MSHSTWLLCVCVCARVYMWHVAMHVAVSGERELFLEYKIRSRMKNVWTRVISLLFISHRYMAALSHVPTTARITGDYGYRHPELSLSIEVHRRLSQVSLGRCPNQQDRNSHGNTHTHTSVNTRTYTHQCAELSRLQVRLTGTAYCSWPLLEGRCLSVLVSSVCLMKFSGHVFCSRWNWQFRLINLWVENVWAKCVIVKCFSSVMLL